MIKGFLVLAMTAIFSQGNAQANFGKIEDKLTLTVSSRVLVLPNTLSVDETETCNTQDVEGPRIRMRSTLQWQGPGNLVPLIIQVAIKDDKLNTEYTGSISSDSSGKESISFLYGVQTDFIPPRNQAYETTSCFLDFGALPHTKEVLKGNALIKVPVKITLIGFVKHQNGKETPLKKEIQAEINYVPGSVPVN